MAAYTAYDIGDQVTVTALFEIGTTDTDPTTVKLKVTTPTGTTTTYTYGTDANITRQSAGNYTGTFDVTMAGYYKWRWIGTTQVKAAKQGFVGVRLENTA